VLIKGRGHTLTLLRGNHPEHEALELEAARYFCAECALCFGSGFAANTTLFATAPQRGDLVVHDELIHASVIDGLRRGRAVAVSARHNDSQAVDDATMPRLQNQRAAPSATPRRRGNPKECAKCGLNAFFAENQAWSPSHPAGCLASVRQRTEVRPHL
jgi:hypothetical protein